MERAFEVKDRVLVTITAPEEYANGAAKSLNGRVGTVEEYEPNYTFHVPRRPAYLVRFDVPATPWHAHQHPVSAFWFEPKDLSPYTASTEGAA
jgi:hypothetical protein